MYCCISAAKSRSCSFSLMSPTWRVPRGRDLYGRARVEELTLRPQWRRSVRPRATHGHPPCHPVLTSPPLQSEIGLDVLKAARRALRLLMWPLLLNGSSWHRNSAFHAIPLRMVQESGSCNSAQPCWMQIRMCLGLLLSSYFSSFSFSPKRSSDYH